MGYRQIKEKYKCGISLEKTAFLGFVGYRPCVNVKDIVKNNMNRHHNYAIV